ncbi:hypothetical protein BRADI_2g35367v3 [Brachypodium distachyon]|uniref:Uncharacterized protein n=1 Tax=Brachypodium distachyon TaxID=15368 RepID=A0A2K2DBX5_BRADI|nr:hypothetical protein BRADI_2g35367v3 [Brachypodium distachyon]
MPRRCNACNTFDVVCKRPNVCLSSFTITMGDGCRDVVAVPHCFIDRLNDFVENFLVVRDLSGFNYDVFVERRKDATVLCGAY